METNHDPQQKYYKEGQKSRTVENSSVFKIVEFKKKKKQNYDVPLTYTMDTFPSRKKDATKPIMTFAQRKPHASPFSFREMR
jgi:hypothetical protein